jgi:hypothetical protein
MTCLAAIRRTDDLRFVTLCRAQQRLPSLQNRQSGAERSYKSTIPYHLADSSPVRALYSQAIALQRTFYLDRLWENSFHRAAVFFRRLGRRHSVAAPLGNPSSSQQDLLWFLGSALV